MSIQELPDGHTYELGRLDAKKQFHLTRRLAPIFLSGGAAAVKLGGSDEDMFKVMQALIDPVSSMKDEDIDYIIDSCLDVVKRKISDKGWAPVRANGMLMYADLDMATMVQLTVKVMVENLGGFFALLSAGNASASGTSAAVPQ